VDADDAPRIVYHTRQLGDRDGRGVARDHDVLADDLVELLHERQFQVEDLRNHFDHEV